MTERHVEWKASWRDDYLEWICGTADAQGNVLEVGQDGQGKVVGVMNVVRLLEEIPNKVQSLLGIVVDVNLKSKSGVEYLQTVVNPYPNPINFKREYHYRNGATKQVRQGSVLSRFLMREHGRMWDGVPMSGLGVGDLNGRTIDSFRRLVHRDYAALVPIQIPMDADRVVLWNPGRLPEEWSIEGLTGSHTLRPHNPVVANAFLRTGLIEAWGLGVQRIVKGCVATGRPAPHWQVEPEGGIRLDVRFLARYTATDAAVVVGTVLRKRHRPVPENGSSYPRKWPNCPKRESSITTEEVMPTTREIRTGTDLNPRTRLGPCSLKFEPRISRRLMTERIDITPSGVKYQLPSCGRPGLLGMLVRPRPGAGKC